MCGTYTGIFCDSSVPRLGSQGWHEECKDLAGERLKRTKFSILLGTGGQTTEENGEIIVIVDRMKVRLDRTQNNLRFSLES